MLAVMAFLFAVTDAAVAQVRVTPEEVAREYTATIRDEGIAAGVRYLHPDELVRFKDMLYPAFTVEGNAGSEALLKGIFGEKATPKSVRAMTAEEFVRGFLGMFETQIKSMNITFGEMEILGSVVEGDVVHLVTRINAGMPEFTLVQMEVVSLKPHGDTWGLMLSGQLDGFGQAIRSQLLKADRK